MVGIHSRDTPQKSQQAGRNNQGDERQILANCWQAKRTVLSSGQLFGCAALDGFKRRTIRCPFWEGELVAVHPHTSGQLLAYPHFLLLLFSRGAYHQSALLGGDENSDQKVPFHRKAYRQTERKWHQKEFQPQAFEPSVRTQQSARRVAGDERLLLEPIGDEPGASLWVILFLSFKPLNF